MKVLLLNIPNKESIVRRMRCSYRSFGFYYPPIELLYLGGILREWKNERPILLDAIAERKKDKEVLKVVKKNAFDIIVCILGFECIDQDMHFLDRVSAASPRSKIICFGYYASIFPVEIMKSCNVDVVIVGEPEITFSQVYDKLQAGEDLSGVEGIAYRDSGRIQETGKRGRIDFNELPLPLRDV